MTNRCYTCKKKVKLDFYECKSCSSSTLEKIFCSEHRFPFAHGCTSDESYSNNLKKIERDNPRVVVKKIETI